VEDACPQERLAHLPRVGLAEQGSAGLVILPRGEEREREREREREVRED